MRFKKDIGFWQVKHHGLYGIVSETHGNVIWTITNDPKHTATWHKANTLMGAKRACAKALRDGRNWKDRKQCSTKVLKEEFKRLAEKITSESTFGPQHIYQTCNTMRRIWEELERRGEEPMWPKDRPTQAFLLAS